MKIRISILTTAVLILLVIFSVGCSSDDAMVEQVEAVAVDEITVIFEPESCEYTGPQAIQQAEVKLIYDNRSENVVIDGVFLIPDGKTWQDFVDYLSREDKNNDMPQWAWDNLQSGSVVIDDPRAKVYDLAPGLYALACGEIYDTGGWKNWPAAPLEVR
jgi:hypothetical protein